MKLADSGNRREFTSGAVRDINEGKGRCDLLPLDVIGNVFGDTILKEINGFIRTGETEYLAKSIRAFTKIHMTDPATAILEVSKHYEDGCEKYGERNWEKGIPLHCYLDSGIRHYLKWVRGDRDEPHDRAFLWNMLGAIWTAVHKPGLCDLPYSREEHHD